MNFLPQGYVYMSARYSMLNKITDRMGDRPIMFSMVSMVTDRMGPIMFSMVSMVTDRMGDGPILSVIQSITIDTVLKNTGLNNGHGLKNVASNQGLSNFLRSTVTVQIDYHKR